jgi:hypothetical protein
MLFLCSEAVKLKEIYQRLTEIYSPYLQSINIVCDLIVV